jgi:polyadenylate-binding protein
MYHTIPPFTCLLTNLNSTSDESALRAKVDEAMSVYDEYVKNKEGEGEKEAPKEESKEEKA